MSQQTISKSANTAHPALFAQSLADGAQTRATEGRSTATKVSIRKPVEEFMKWCE